jgi:hypothetical protein
VIVSAVILRQRAQCTRGCRRGRGRRRRCSVGQLPRP